MSLGRIKLKVSREGREQWVHFCYTDKILTDRFETEFKPPTDDPMYSYWVSKWAYEDFGIVVNSWEDLEELKIVIKNMYKSIYPELYLESAIDKQGWSRVWVNKHMDKEIRKNEFER